MLIPVEMLSELKNATPEQAADLHCEQGLRLVANWTTPLLPRLHATAGA